jgi:hypothetical protein
MERSGSRRPKIIRIRNSGFIARKSFSFVFQLLESYRSLTLGYMADAFGVTEDYMDSELCRYTLHSIYSIIS